MFDKSRFLPQKLHFTRDGARIVANGRCRRNAKSEALHRNLLAETHLYYDAKSNHFHLLDLCAIDIDYVPIGHGYRVGDRLRRGRP